MVVSQMDPQVIWFHSPLTEGLVLLAWKVEHSSVAHQPSPPKQNKTKQKNV